MNLRSGMADTSWGVRCGLIARHAGLLTAMSLVWEFAQMPFYTLWATASAAEIVFAGLHCTVGDALIGTAALFGAMVLVGPARWPHDGRARVLIVAVSIGLAYTVFSEWLNVEVRGAWSYSELMPVVPPFGTGLTPLLQWVTLPVVAYLWAISIAPIGQDHRERASRSDAAPTGRSARARAWVTARLPGVSLRVPWPRSRRDPFSVLQPGIRRKQSLTSEEPIEW